MLRYVGSDDEPGSRWRVGGRIEATERPGNEGDEASALSQKQNQEGDRRGGDRFAAENPDEDREPKGNRAAHHQDRGLDQKKDELSAKDLKIAR